MTTQGDEAPTRTRSATDDAGPEAEAAGAELEAALFEAMRARVAAAYGAAGQQAVSGFWQVLQGLIPVEDRALVLDLGRGG